MAWDYLVQQIKTCKLNFINYFFSDWGFLPSSFLPASFFSASAPPFSSAPSLGAAASCESVEPSAPSSPSAASAGFSGSLITVGAATVAITKSLPVIVGRTFSGSFIDDILKLCPISVSYTDPRVIHKC